MSDDELVDSVFDLEVEEVVPIPKSSNDDGDIEEEGDTNGSS